MRAAPTNRCRGEGHLDLANSERRSIQWPLVFSQLESIYRGGDRTGVASADTIRRAAEELASPRPRSTALIIADVDLHYRPFGDAMAGLGRDCITVSHPLEVLVCLQDASLEIDVVLAPARDSRFRALEFFAFMKDAFPGVRRVLYAERVPEEYADALSVGLLDALLTSDAPPHEFAVVVQPMSEVARLATRPWGSPRDDGSPERTPARVSHPYDREAFDEHDRHYRTRIHHLATAMGFSDADADEIVQESLLGLFLKGKMLRGEFTPDDVICDLAATSVLAHLRSERRWERLLQVIAHTDRAARAERERAGQPDQALQTFELAGRADAAVQALPTWCRRVFLLRVVDGQSAKEIGLTLDIVPIMVEFWLLHARRLIAGYLQPYLA